MKPRNEKQKHKSFNNGFRNTVKVKNSSRRPQGIIFIIGILFETLFVMVYF